MSMKISKGARIHLITVARRNEFQQDVRELRRLGLVATGLIRWPALAIAHRPAGAPLDRGDIVYHDDLGLRADSH